ncbi:hypothetical protein ABL78_1694 [Leptomonas seymouri]|uniref:Uncharacterized protein n=1 Tax=Leptomonas seymouri TaxID=5684 RepID=A0A0N1IAA1_LEPSE|nr:hypothetical protein ABL78_1694 [Leptomonas seymouri]|eukprot:KPI89201.1 hypothetical protein ABL78_1694 [Leptomonas seymouri]
MSLPTAAVSTLGEACEAPRTHRAKADETATTYVFSKRSLLNPRRFAELLKSVSERAAARRSLPHPPLPISCSPPTPPAAVSQRRWSWQRPSVLPSASLDTPLTLGGHRPSHSRGAHFSSSDESVQHTRVPQSPEHLPSASPNRRQRSPYATETHQPNSDATAAPTAAITSSGTSAEDVFSAAAVTRLVQDVQQELHRLQECVDDMHLSITPFQRGATTAVTAPLAGAAMPSHETASSDMVTTPDCNTTVGWESIESVPAALINHDTTRIQRDCNEERGEDARAGDQPVVTPAGETGKSTVAVSHREPHLSPLPSAPAGQYSANGVEVKLQECLKTMDHSEKAATCSGASTPSPFAITAPVPLASLAPLPTVPLQGNFILSDGSSGGLSGLHVTDGGTPSITALPGLVADAAGTASTLGHQSEEMVLQNSWAEAVKAAEQHIFVEGDDGRPVTALRHRVLVVAAHATSPPSTQLSFSDLKAQARGESARGERRDTAEGASGATLSMDREGAYCMLDVYTWNMSSPLSRRRTSFASAGAESEAPLLLASTASAVRPSLATTMTVYALPGEDGGLLLTPPSVTTVDPLESSTGETHQPNKPQTADVQLAVQQDDREDDGSCCGDVLTPLALLAEQHLAAFARCASTDSTAKEEGRVMSSRVEGAACKRASGTPAEALLTQVMEANRKHMPPLMAAAMAAEVRSAHRAVAGGGDTAMAKMTEECKEIGPVDNANLGSSINRAEDVRHGVAVCSTEVRPATSRSRRRNKGGAAAATLEATKRTEAITLPESSTQGAAQPAPDAGRASGGAPHRYQRRLLNCEVVEFPQVCTVSVLNTPPEPSELTKSPLAPFTAESTSGLLQQAPSCQFLTEAAFHADVNHEGVDEAGPVLHYESRGSRGAANTQESYHSKVAEVTSLQAVPLARTAASDGGDTLFTAATYRDGVSDGHIHHSAADNTGDLPASLDLSPIKDTYGALGEAGHHGVNSDDAVTRDASEPPPPKPPSSAAPRELPESSTQRQQRAVGRRHRCNCHGVGYRHVPSEPSWQITSDMSSTSHLIRPGAPSPKSHSQNSVFSPLTRSQLPPSPSLTKRKPYSQPVDTMATRDAMGEGVGAHTAPHGGLAAAPAASQDSSPDSHREHSPAVKSDEEAMRSLSKSPTPRTPPAMTTTTPFFLLPALAVSRSITAGGAPQSKNGDGNRGERCQGRHPSGCGSPSSRMRGTSVLTTGQYRLWASSRSCHAAPTERVASAPMCDGFRRPCFSLFPASTGALRAPTALLPSSAHAALRFPKKERHSLL